MMEPIALGLGVLSLIMVVALVLLGLYSVLGSIGRNCVRVLVTNFRHFVSSRKQVYHVLNGLLIRVMPVNGSKVELLLYVGLFLTAIVVVALFSLIPWSVLLMLLFT